MQNVIMKRGLRAHEKERYMRGDMLNSDNISHDPRAFSAKFVPIKATSCDSKIL